MKMSWLCLSLLALLAVGCNSPSQAPQTKSSVAADPPTQPLTPARRYFNELKAADGLDKKANEYVCFRDDPEDDSFFIFGEGRIVADFLAESNHPLPKKDKEMMDKTLIVKHYRKGVATYGGYEYLTQEADQYVSDPGKVKGELIRVRFMLNWQTLRYMRTAERKSGDRWILIGNPIYGRCEKMY